MSQQIKYLSLEIENLEYLKDHPGYRYEEKYASPIDREKKHPRTTKTKYHYKMI